MKQSIPVDYNTRYTQNMTNLSSGTSVFVIPPNQGCRHAILVLGYSASAFSGLNNAALERGWGYSALQQISFRIGGSSQYFLTGEQLLARNLRLCRTKEQRNSILSLGGDQILSTDIPTVERYAYIPLSIWAAPSEDELGVPLPTDLLSQQVQITAQLRPASEFWIQNTTAGATTPVYPTSFSTGYFQIEQLEMKDRGMALANRVDMNTHMYAMPLPTFDQVEVVFPQTPSATSVPIVLTGFRAGEVKKIQMWCVKKSGGATFVVNPLNYVKPQAVTLLYAGLTYAVYNNGSSAIWNLLDGTAPSAVDQAVIAATVGGGFTVTSGLSEWVELPFAQPTGSDYEADVLVHGKEITNGIVNLQVTLPDATSSWDIHVVYVYNCSVGFSKGSAELIF